MAVSPERTPRERETLIFAQPHEAERFAEQVNERVQQEKQPGIKRDREIVAEEVAKQFEQAGESVKMIRQPWEHTPAEHAEVQDLVNVAFAQDLPAALQKAKASPHYPRNLDLLHDLLTQEMYQHLQGAKINRQPVLVWLIMIVAVVLVSLFGVLVLFLI